MQNDTETFLLSDIFKGLTWPQRPVDLFSDATTSFGRAFGIMGPNNTYYIFIAIV